MLRLRVLFLRAVLNGRMKAGDDGSEAGTKLGIDEAGVVRAPAEPILANGTTVEVSTARFLRLRGFLACETGRLRCARLAGRPSSIYEWIEEADAGESGEVEGVSSGMGDSKRVLELVGELSVDADTVDMLDRCMQEGRCPSKAKTGRASTLGGGRLQLVVLESPREVSFRSDLWQ